jgi:uridine kinase
MPSFASLLTLTGGAGAGKTTLAAALAAQHHVVTVLHLDDYYDFTDYSRGVWVPDATGTPRLDVGDPRSVDFTRLDADADAALETSAVVIVEGLFAIRTTPSSAHTRFDVFVDLPADLRLARKIQRQCVRGDFPVGILLDNYLNHRRVAHQRHIEPVRYQCDLVVDAELPTDHVVTPGWGAAAQGGRS